MFSKASYSDLYLFTFRYKFGVLDGATTWIFAKTDNEQLDFNEITVQGGGHLAFNSSVSLTSNVNIDVEMFYGDKTGLYYYLYWSLWYFGPYGQYF